MTSSSDTLYRFLIERCKKLSLLKSASALLDWDEQTYLPEKAVEFRAEQMAYFSGMAHELFTSADVGEALGACEAAGFAQDSDEAANVREWRRRYDRQTKLPKIFVEELQRTSTLGRSAWMEARKRSDFGFFAPFLEKLVTLQRQAVDFWGYDESPYDALLEEYEPGARASELKILFGKLQPALSSLLQEAAERSKSIPANILEGDYPLYAQKMFNQRVAEAFGFDLNAGRIDTAAHPFCTILGPYDCRLTTRYSETDFTSSFYSVLHETGHGLYEQGLLPQAYGTPMGEACSLGIHESQSRFWENQIGRGLSFWSYWLGQAAEFLPHLKKFTPESLYRAVNRVCPSFIRTEADQVSYDLHIILRFELEMALIEGELKVSDLPFIWNERFKQLMGLCVPGDAQGCLQDVHWSGMGMGYFPTYTLGNLNAAQLYRCMLHENPGMDDSLRQGEYAQTLAWLRQKIHIHGSRYSSQELMWHATGERTNERYYLEYLRAKFLS